MQKHAITQTPADVPLPADDPRRALTVRNPDDADARHVAVVGDTYTIVVSGDETDGRYCLIDMLVADGGGPPLHRHDFEEMFTLLEGELQFTFRGERRTVRAGATVNIPANAPHHFTNVSGKPARVLCMCTPAGQDAFFLAVGMPLPSRTSAAPALSDADQQRFGAESQRLAPTYRTELLGTAPRNGA